MAERHTVIMMEDDGLDAIEAEVLKKHFGEKRAKELLKDSDVMEMEELDPELQEIVDGTPALV